MQHAYTIESLHPGDAGFVTRVPGVREIVRQFPEPSSIGRGSLGVEGGITVVAGPGMGKTSLLRQLAHTLETERGIPAALIALPKSGPHEAPDGFYRFLGSLVKSAREQLARSPLVAESRFDPLRTRLAQEPPWDASAEAMTPRGIERWVGELGQAAAHAGGVCLVFDDVDNAFSATWKAAFVAALRFTFQASTGITPIYGAWKVFLDESLPGSNYFRNVTRPLFLEPLSADSGERDALINVSLSAATPAVRSKLSTLLGGHPRVWHQTLADLCREPATEEALLAGFDAAVEDGAERTRTLVRTLVEDSPKLQATLHRIAEARAHQPHAFRTLPKAVVATGLVDCDADGFAVVPQRVLEGIKRP